MLLELAVLLGGYECTPDAPVTKNDGQYSAGLESPLFIMKDFPFFGFDGILYL